MKKVFSNYDDYLMQQFTVLYTAVTLLLRSVLHIRQDVLVTAFFIFYTCFV